MKKEERIPVSKNFYLDEFIDPVTYAEHGKDSIKFIDLRIVMIAQFLRDLTGRSVSVNTWWNGGHRKESGLRRSDTSTGAKLSMHKKGQAIDTQVSGMPPREVFNVVRDNAKQFFDLGLRRIEDLSLTTTWNHFDLRPHSKGRLIRIIDLRKETGTIAA